MPSHESEIALDCFGDILTPKEIAKLMPSSVSQSWIYAHWEELGGVKIGGLKLISKEVFDDNFQKERLVLRQDRKGRQKVDTNQSGNGTVQMENKKGSKKGGSQAKRIRFGTVNHTNEFGLADAVKRVPERRKGKPPRS
jgi:hypothetical protein